MLRCAGGCFRARDTGFNPHPRRGAGAAIARRIISRSIWFQSSPAPRRGCCNRSGIRAVHLPCFNPHPRRGAGAARGGTRQAQRDERFNPHPRRGAGAASFWCLPPERRQVSILTRAEARVLRSTLRSWRKSMSGFNPHPRRGAGAAPSFRRLIQLFKLCFNPHPRRGAGAAYSHDSWTLKRSRFQSSPAPRRGCCVQPCMPSRSFPRFNPHPRRGAGAALHAKRRRS